MYGQPRELFFSNREKSNMAISMLNVKGILENKINHFD